MADEKAGTSDQDNFGSIQMIGCVGMLACAAAALGLLLVAGGYTLATGDALQIPILEVGLAWVGVAVVFEFMAFGWLMMRLAAVAVIGGGLGALVGVLIRTL